jgi:hypothetical protein
MNHRPLYLALTVLAFAACSSDEGTEPTTAIDTTTSETVESTSIPNATTSSTSPTTSADVTTTSAPDAPQSTVDAGVVDWRQVVETLGQRRQDLYAAPDVSRILEVCGDGTPCAEQLNVQIGDLADKGWHVEGADPFTVLDTRVEQFDGDSLETSLLVTVVAVIERAESAGTIVDESGTEIAAVEPETELGFNAQGRFLLGRVGPPDDPWRLISQDTLPEVPA